jgi:hypothetical protein
MYQKYAERNNLRASPISCTEVCIEIVAYQGDLSEICSCSADKELNLNLRIACNRPRRGDIKSLSWRLLVSAYSVN